MVLFMVYLIVLAMLLFASALVSLLVLLLSLLSSLSLLLYLYIYIYVLLLLVVVVVYYYHSYYYQQQYYHCQYHYQYGYYPPGCRRCARRDSAPCSGRLHNIIIVNCNSCNMTRILCYNDRLYEIRTMIQYIVIQYTRCKLIYSIISYYNIETALLYIIRYQLTYIYIYIYTYVYIYIYIYREISSNPL